MTGATDQPVVRTAEDFQRALRRAAQLRQAGATAEDDQELAALEGAIAHYVAKPGRPAGRKGRPKDSGEGM